MSTIQIWRVEYGLGTKPRPVFVHTLSLGDLPQGSAEKFLSVFGQDFRIWQEKELDQRDGALQPRV
jgi:hypothetical protein